VLVVNATTAPPARIDVKIQTVSETRSSAVARTALREQFSACIRIHGERSKS
jgi:hypothetical protein